MTMTHTTTATDTTITAPELATTLTVPYEAALNGIAAVLPHADKANTVAVILAAVQITPSHFITTDRYTIGRYAHNAPIHPDTDAVTIPRTAAEWLTKQTAKMLDRDARYLAHSATVTFTAEGITIAVDGQTLAVHTFTALTGQFPPVERLLIGWEAGMDAAAIAFDPDRLTRFATSAKKLPKEDTVRGMVVEIGKGTSAAVRVTIGKRFDGLIQPVRELR